jgi:putative ABC transport system permease protein
MQTPLAWKNLTSSPGKCLLAATGVGFAVVLMFMQIGFRFALLDSNVQVFTMFDADLVVTSRARYNVATEQRFDRPLLDELSAQENVRAVCKVYIERGTASIKIVGHRPRPIRVIAMELCRDFFRDPQLFEKLVEVDQHTAALVDIRSKSNYGFANTEELLTQQTAELNNKQIDLGGHFRLGTDFAHDGTLLISQRMLPEYFPWRNRSGDPLEMIDIGLLKIDAGADPVEVRDRLREIAPQQITVHMMDEIIERDVRFWARSTPIGVIFDIGTLMGVIVGAIICYQIQFTDISEHMPEFATLKAMGYRPSYFWGVVLCQSLYLACLGFVPGWLVSAGLYWILADQSGLIMRMAFWRIITVLALTIGMCIVSGVLAIRKLFGADPASLF